MLCALYFLLIDQTSYRYHIPKEQLEEIWNKIVTSVKHGLQKNASRGAGKSGIAFCYCRTLLINSRVNVSFRIFVKEGKHNNSRVKGGKE